MEMGGKILENLQSFLPPRPPLLQSPYRDY